MSKPVFPTTHLQAFARCFVVSTLNRFQLVMPWGRGCMGMCRKGAGTQPGAEQKAGKGGLCSWAVPGCELDGNTWCSEEAARTWGRYVHFKRPSTRPANEHGTQRASFPGKKFLDMDGCFVASCESAGGVQPRVPPPKCVFSPWFLFKGTPKGCPHKKTKRPCQFSLPRLDLTRFGKISKLGINKFTCSVWPIP